MTKDVLRAHPDDTRYWSDFHNCRENTSNSRDKNDDYHLDYGAHNHFLRERSVCNA